MIHSPDQDPLRVQLVAAVVKYLRGAKAKRSSTLKMLDRLVGAALDNEIGALEIASLITATINHSATRHSPQAEELRQRYLRRGSKLWAGVFGTEYNKR